MLEAGLAPSGYYGLLPPSIYRVERLPPIAVNEYSSPPSGNQTTNEES